MVIIARFCTALYIYKLVFELGGGHNSMVLHCLVFYIYVCVSFDISGRGFGS